MLLFFPTFTILIAPHDFSYFFPYPSHSLFYVCIFGCILGLVALIVSGWSALNCLVAATFIGVLGFRLVLIFAFLVSKISCCSFVCFLLFLCFFFSIAFPRVATDCMVSRGRAPLATLGSPGALSSQFMASNLPPQMLLRVLRRGCFRFRLRDFFFFGVYFPGSAVFRLNRLSSGRM